MNSKKLGKYFVFYIRGHLLMTSRKYGDFLIPLPAPLCHTAYLGHLPSHKIRNPRPHLREVIYEQPFKEVQGLESFILIQTL